MKNSRTYPRASTSEPGWTEKVEVNEISWPEERKLKPILDLYDLVTEDAIVHVRVNRNKVTKTKTYTLTIKFKS